MAENAGPEGLKGENSQNTSKKGESAMSSDEKEQKRVTRREFVRGAAVGAAGVAAAGVLASCTPEVVKETVEVPVEVIKEVPVEVIKEVEVKSWLPEKWDQETDVVVVGSGMAGFCAAIEAKRAGADVIVVDKNFYPGGNTLLCAGNTILGGTHVQAAAGMEDSPEWWYEETMEVGDQRAQKDLLAVYTKKGEEFLTWYESLGMEWKPFETPETPGDYMTVRRGHSPAASENYPGTRGFALEIVLYQEIQKLGIPVLLNTKMTRIIREPNGPVLGIETVAEGKTINFKARKAVVLGCGGFKGNVQMRMAWDPRMDDELGAGGLPYVETTGEGLMAAVDIGAGTTDMSFVCELRVRWGTLTYQLWEPPALTTIGTTGSAGLRIRDFSRLILVKDDGNRYVDEGAPSANPEDLFFQAYLNLRERPRNVWAVVDADGAEALGFTRDQFENPEPKVTPALYPGCVAVADSIQDLAISMGISSTGLGATISRFNGFVDAGEDADFGKPMPMYKIVKPPFFGVKLLVLAHDQMAGLRANTRAQVLERSNQIANQFTPIDDEPVIPHLYAAGECVGGYYGTTRGHGKVGVCGIWGRIAGQNAAKETSLA